MAFFQSNVDGNPDLIRFEVSNTDFDIFISKDTTMIDKILLYITNKYSRGLSVVELLVAIL